MDWKYGLCDVHSAGPVQKMLFFLRYVTNVHSIEKLLQMDGSSNVMSYEKASSDLSSVHPLLQEYSYSTACSYLVVFDWSSLSQAKFLLAVEKSYKLKQTY